MTQDSDLDAGAIGMEREHQVQLGLILGLEQGLALGKGHDQLLDIVYQLVDYTNVHFMSEQLLMRLYAYPEIGAHEATHDRLMEQARRVVTDFASGELSIISTDLLLFKQGLLDHMRTDDHAFHLHLGAQTASP